MHERLIADNWLCAVVINNIPISITDYFAFIFQIASYAREAKLKKKTRLPPHFAFNQNCKDYTAYGNTAASSHVVTRCQTVAARRTFNAFCIL
jgi:hypothetical protein